MKKHNTLLCGLALAAVWLTSVSSTFAEDWMFRRSYYSHELPEGEIPPYPLPESRSAYRPAFYQPALGFRSAYRVNNFTLQSGNRFDRTVYREGWLEPLP